MADNIYDILLIGGRKTMRIVMLQSRQDHDTLLSRTAAFGATLVLAALTAVPWQAALSQGAVPCTAIDNDAERLACYDRALRGAPPAANPDPPARSATPAPAAPAPPPAAVGAETPRAERALRESAVATAPAAPPAAGRSGGTEEITPLVIVGVRTLPGRETTFTAADGSSWVQTDGQRLVGMPDTPFDAELKPGAMGSYFLVPKDRGRAIRVRPLR
jgi:hypothetical protein